MYQQFTLGALEVDFCRYVDGDKKPTLILMVPHVYNQMYARMVPQDRQPQPIEFSAEGIAVTVRKTGPLRFNGVNVIQIPHIPNDKGYLILPDISILNEMDICEWRMGIE